METVGLLSCMCSEDFYCWGFVWVGQATDLFSEEMVMEVVDFDVVDFEDFVENFVEEGNVDMVDRMVDIGNTESIFHRYFVLLAPRFVIDFEIGAKVAAKNSNLVEVDYTFDHEILVFGSLLRPSRDRIEIFYGTCRNFLLKDIFKTKK